MVTFKNMGSIQEVTVNSFFGEINQEFPLHHKDRIKNKSRGKRSFEKVIVTTNKSGFVKLTKQKLRAMTS